MIYLDHNATTPIAPAVLEAMRPYLEQHFGNPSSAHDAGATAAAAVARARAEVAALLGGEPGGVVFTASGSEADNLAITGSRSRGWESATTSSPRPWSTRPYAPRAATSSAAWASG